MLVPDEMCGGADTQLLVSAETSPGMNKHQPEHPSLLLWTKVANEKNKYDIYYKKDPIVSSVNDEERF